MRDCPEEQEPDCPGDQQPDHDAAAAARLAAAPTTAVAVATALGGRAVDEVEQRRGHTLAAMGGERVGRQPARYPR